MADNGPNSESPLLTKNDLLECFASASFARPPVQAAVSPTLNKLILAINRHEKAFKEQENELSQLRSVVNDQRQQICTQAEQTKILNFKQAQQEAENKKVQLNTLKISGLNEENPKEDFIETTKNKLNIELKKSDFSLTIQERKQRKASKRTGNGKTESPKGKPRGKPQLCKWRNHSLSSNSTPYGKTWTLLRPGRATRHRCPHVRRHQCQAARSLLSMSAT